MATRRAPHSNSRPPRTRCAAAPTRTPPPPSGRPQVYDLGETVFVNVAHNATDRPVEFNQPLGQLYHADATNCARRRLPAPR